MVMITNEVLGFGSYATGLELKCKGQRFACKKTHDIVLVLMQGGNDLLSRACHPNIVQFVGPCSPDYPCM